MSNIVAIPPMTPKQSLLAQIAKLVEEIEADQVTGFAYVALQLSDAPQDPPTSYYRWCQSMALLGAATQLVRFMTDGPADYRTDTPSWDQGA